MHLDLDLEMLRTHHRDREIKIEELFVREDGGVRGKRREVNGENVILGQIHLVFLILHRGILRMKGVKSACVNTKGREEEAEVGDKGFTGGGGGRAGGRGIKQNPG